MGGACPWRWQSMVPMRMIRLWSRKRWGEFRCGGPDRRLASGNIFVETKGTMPKPCAARPDDAATRSTFLAKVTIRRDGNTRRAKPDAGSWNAHTLGRTERVDS